MGPDPDGDRYMTDGATGTVGHITLVRLLFFRLSKLRRHAHAYKTNRIIVKRVTHIFKIQNLKPGEEEPKEEMRRI